MKSLQLFEIAKSDLNSSKLLYEKGLYPQAVFYLQQSVEKMTKSLGIQLSIIPDEKALKKVGHRPVKVFGKVTENMADSMNRMKIAGETVPKLKGLYDFLDYDVSGMEKGYQEIKKNLDDISQNPKKYRNFTEEELNEKFKEIDQREQELNGAEVNIQTELTEADMEEWKDRAKELNKIIVNIFDNDVPEKMRVDSDELEKMLENPDLYRDLFTKFIPLMEIENESLSLLSLSIITQPHAVIARYPDDDLPSDFYSEELPLIKALPKIYVIMERTVFRIENSGLFKEENN